MEYLHFQYEKHLQSLVHFPASYVSLPEGNGFFLGGISHQFLTTWQHGFESLVKNEIPNSQMPQAKQGLLPSGKLTWLAMGNGPDWVDVFPIENGDISASYVSVLEGNMEFHWQVVSRHPQKTSEKLSKYQG